MLGSMPSTRIQILGSMFVISPFMHEGTYLLSLDFQRQGAPACREWSHALQLKHNSGEAGASSEPLMHKAGWNRPFT